MRDIQEIRLQNLGFLLQEIEAELGKARGAAAALATRSGVSRSLISMLQSGALHSESGKRRVIGDDTATKLEQGMNKLPGWMDIDRSEAKDFREAAFLDKLRALTPTQREALERMMDELASASRAPPAARGSDD